MSANVSNAEQCKFTITAETFHLLGKKVTKTSSLDSFRAHFVADPIHCAMIWDLICADVEPGLMPIHLLWCLAFFVCYIDICVLSAMFDVETEEYWYWTKIVLDLMAKNVAKIVSKFERLTTFQDTFLLDVA